jgi:HAD superfamily hydrolase (TIGR01450 family)
MAGLVDLYDGFAIDLDGVVWRGSEPIEGAADGVAAIRAAGKPVLFLTNNAILRPAAVAERLTRMGINARVSEVMTSALAARDWIEEKNLVGAAAFILADETVEEQFADLLDVRPISTGEEVGLVVAGRDTRLTFERLKIASDAVRKGASLMALNRDSVLPVEGGFEPGTGAILAALEAASATGGEAVGKPELPMMQSAQRALGVTNVLMVGDQTSSDVVGARRIGWDAALVLSGVTADIENLDPRPDYVIRSLQAIAEDLEERLQPQT